MAKTKNSHNAAVGSTVERDDSRIKSTGEVFTPMSLVYEMIDEIPDDVMRDPSKTFMDNSCGCGNFLAGLLDRLTNKFGHDKQHVLDHMLYAVDLMPDNVRETCERLGVEFGHLHYVAADGLRYHYRFDGSHPYDDENIGTLEAFL